MIGPTRWWRASNDLGIIAYVPDAVIRCVLSRLEDDPYFGMVPVSREDEAMRIVAGPTPSGRGAPVRLVKGVLLNMVFAWAVTVGSQT